MYQTERVLILSSFALKLQLQQGVKRVNFVVIHSVAPVDTMQKCDGFWLPGAKHFQTVYYINGFAAIIFSRYYTINSHYNSVKNRIYFAYIVLSIKQDTAHKRYNAAHRDKKRHTGKANWLRGVPRSIYWPICWSKMFHRRSQRAMALIPCFWKLVIEKATFEQHTDNYH